MKRNMIILAMLLCSGIFFSTNLLNQVAAEEPIASQVQTVDNTQDVQTNGSETEDEDVDLFSLMFIPSCTLF